MKLFDAAFLTTTLAAFTVSCVRRDDRVSALPERSSQYASILDLAPTGPVLKAGSPKAATHPPAPRAPAPRPVAKVCIKKCSAFIV